MKIGYFYIKAGNGHFIPAKALHEKTIEQFGEGSSELVDFYRDAVKDDRIAKWTQKMWSKIMLEPARERLESWLYDHNFLFCNTIHKHNLCRRFRKNFAHYMSQHRFDCIVATNCVIASVIALLLKKCRIEIPVYYYCSDLIFSYRFVASDKNVSGFFAPSDECVENLKKKGARNIYKIPIPIQNQIYSSQFRDKLSAKELLGIDKDKFCILFQLGGEGKGRFKLLELCAKNGLNINFIVLGKLSDDTLNALDKFKQNYPNISVTTPGFVSNVQDYVMASDIVMSQSGLNAIAESLYLKTPVLLSLLFYVGYPMKLFIEQKDIGVCETLPKAQFKCIKRLVENPDILRRYSENISNLNFDYDAGKAARIIYETVESESGF